MYLGKSVLVCTNLFQFHCETTHFK